MPISVSIVDDDAEARGLWADWINQTTDLTCLSQYGTAESAEVHLPHERPAIVLMDINLAGSNGTECVRHLKPQLPETQFVMLTVYGDAEHVFAALAAGATGYLLKRISQETLLAALREVQAGGSPMSSVIARQVVQFLNQTRVPVPQASLLSDREHEILQLLTEGCQNKEIVNRLGISLSTVATYIRRIYEKLHVHSRAEAVGKFATLVPR